MAGELIVEDWQAEFGGYRFDDIVELEGIEGLPDIRTSDQERGRQHGSLPGPQYAGVRVVTMVAEIASDTMRAEVDAMSAATQPDRAEEPFVFRAGHDVARMIYARVRRRALPSSLEFSYGLGRATLQFVATDPRVYSTTLRSMATGPGMVVGGLAFPHGFPHGFGTATSGSFVVDNDGTAAAPWTATLTGPITSPTIRLAGLGGELALNGFSLATGDTLEFDSLNRTVLLNGTASRYGSLTRRDWFALPVGQSVVSLGASSGSGILTMSWRDTYL